MDKNSNWGGQRAGAGRPRKPTKVFQIRLTTAAHSFAIEKAKANFLSIGDYVTQLFCKDGFNPNSK